MAYKLCFLPQVRKAAAFFQLSQKAQRRVKTMYESDSCPCKFCVPPKRHPACHGSCPEFTKFNEKRLDIKALKRKAKSQEAMIDSYVVSQSNKYQRRKNTESARKRK